MTYTVGLVVFDEVDLLDTGGPYEVFLTASRLAVRDGSAPPFEVITVGVSRDPVTAYGGLGLVPQRTLAEMDGIDVLVVPGAIDIEAVRKNRALSEALAAAIERTKLVTSVCTGAFLLADHSLLVDGGWTTHWEDLGILDEQVSEAPAPGTPPWVDAGSVITAGGLSSGIAMALHVVDRLCGRDLAVRTARQIDYAWDPDGGVVAAPRD